MGDNSDSSNGFGVITSVDGIDAADIDRTHREGWVEQLLDKLVEIDGVVGGDVDDATKSYSSVRIFVELEAEFVEGYGYSIDANLNSAGQKISNIVNSDIYATANIIEPKIESPEKNSHGGYDTKYYFIDIEYP